MAYPALVMGWAALGNGIDVTIFFTFWGMDMINKHRVDHLEIPAGRQLQHEDEPDGRARLCGHPAIMGMLPGMTPFATNLVDE
jgi:peroxiredoxin family protein